MNLQDDRVELHVSWSRTKLPERTIRSQHGHVIVYIRVSWVAKDVSVFGDDAHPYFIG